LPRLWARPGSFKHYRTVCGTTGSWTFLSLAASAKETGNARALKHLPDALVELLLRLYNAMIARQIGQVVDPET
jgi:hypothetical protein